MGESNGFFQHGIVKIEIAFVHAHVEVLAAEINGICAGLDTGGECVPSTGRCEQFNGFTCQ